MKEQAIQMIKIEKRKKRKKGTTLEKECTSASLDVHYFHVSSHYRLLGRPEILTTKRGALQHNQKGLLPKGCQSKAPFGDPI
jgi:hypothetical protein